MTDLDAQAAFITEIHHGVAVATDGMSLMSVVDRLEGPVFDALPPSVKDDLWHHIESARLALLRKTGAGTP